MPMDATTPQVPILIGDDDESFRSALARYLATQGFDVSIAASGPGVLDRLRHTQVAMVLLDVAMPGMSGADVVPKALEIDPDLAIIMLSGVNDATIAASCMQHGAMDYLTKPIDLSELTRAIEGGLRRRDTVLQSRELDGWLHQELDRRGHEVEEERRRQEQITLATLESLITALEYKDPFLRGHSARVAALAATIAHELGLPDLEIEQVRMAGRLHDLGMIGIREDVLNKRGQLTPEEREHVNEHVVIGTQILEPLGHLGPVVHFVRSHHEHWDGTGYPDGLAGDAIPMGGRILCAAEVYDALTTFRPYQHTVSPEEALDRMRSLVGTVLDADVMNALARASARRRTLVFLDEDPYPLAEKAVESDRTAGT